MESKQGEQEKKGVRVMKEKRGHSFITSVTVFVGLFLVLVGVVLLLWAQDIATWKETLAYFFLGLGAIFLLNTITHYVSGPRSFMCIRLTNSLLFLSAGGAVLGGIASWWPLMPILVGVGILLNLLLGSALKK
jgi:hypothetical protein